MCAINKQTWENSNIIYRKFYLSTKNEKEHNEVCELNQSKTYTAFAQSIQPQHNVDSQVESTSKRKINILHILKNPKHINLRTILLF